MVDIRWTLYVHTIKREIDEYYKANVSKHIHINLCMERHFQKPGILDDCGPV